jgi:hypothetical protein
LTQKGLADQASILRLEGEKRGLVAEIKLAQQNLADLRGQTEAVELAVKDAELQRQKIWDQLVKTTNDVMVALAEIARADNRQVVLAEQAQKDKVLLQWAKVSPSDMPKEPPAGLSGEVTGIRGSDIEISVGADDGVHEGQRFAVTRPSTGHYICDIVVFKVPYPNRAVCRADKQTMRDQVQKGDYVQANISKRR